MHDVSLNPPSDLAFSEHGGNLGLARRAFPHAPEPWRDLSTGISPHPYPFPALQEECFTRLPDEEAINRLEALAGAFFGVRLSASVVAAAGSQAIIQWLPLILRARKVGILGPTYSEFARAFARAGAEVSLCEDIEELAAMDCAIIVNPNNPDGRHIPVDALQSLAERLAAQGGTLVVDEAFADFLAPSDSLASCLPAKSAIILRSFGKSFGLAGVRLGFAIAAPDVAVALRAALGPWPISGMAIAIGTRAYGDSAWFEATRAALIVGSAATDRILREAGFSIIGGTTLFRLARHAKAGDIFRGLAHAGILVRPFALHGDWLRFGIPGSEADRARLADALAMNQHC